MNAYVSEASARATIDYRVRDAEYRRMARQAQGHEQSAKGHHAVPKARRHSRLWNVVTFGHSYA